MSFLCYHLSAVAIMSQAPSLRISSGGPSFGKAPPVGLKPLSFGARGGSVSVKREWNEANWKVNSLDPVPLDFPLERTRREIHGANAAQVAERISNTLRVLSVEAEYDGEKAKAKCKTNDMVSFRIRLFAGDEGNQQPVIVEIQRRSGSPSCFMRVCRQILDGAEGMEIPADTVPARKKMPSCMMKAPVSSLKCIQKESAVRDPQAEAISSIQKSLELLRSKEMDTNCLGLDCANDSAELRTSMASLARLVNGRCVSAGMGDRARYQSPSNINRQYSRAIFDSAVSLR